MNQAERGDVDLAREYVRAIKAVGHAGLFAGADRRRLARVRGALRDVGAFHAAMIFEEAMTLDEASRDDGGAPLRDYLEVEELALRRLDRELFRQLPKLEAQLERESVTGSARPSAMAG